MDAVATVATGPERVRIRYDSRRHSIRSVSRHRRPRQRGRVVDLGSQLCGGHGGAPAFQAQFALDIDP